MTDFSEQKASEGPRSNHGAAAGFSAGQILAGKYKVVALIGKGGMGTVYRVQQIFLDKTLALKVLDSAKVSDDVQMRRFF